MERQLAPYATLWQQSRGRLVAEPEQQSRTPFQRDRDRIIHSEAFRRLQYKTQVFVNHEGDHYRTRLTHSLEVAQITRSICRALHLDDDLGEAVALAHDLGHPPFGHAGEDALNEAMQPYGGYRHNEQTLKLVRVLEHKYGNFDGLNLTWEALEGIAKHNGPITDVNEQGTLFESLEIDTWCGLEAQAAALADDIAYNHHDIEDGLNAGILDIAQVIEGIPAFASIWHEVKKLYPEASESRLVRETTRRMMHNQIEDVLATSRANLARIKPKSVEDVRHAGQAIIAFSPEMAAATKALKKFMYQNMYIHYRVSRMSLKAHKVVKELARIFMEHQRCLPTEFQQRIGDKKDMQQRATVVCDYISGMTDRYAMLEYERLTDPRLKT